MTVQIMKIFKQCNDNLVRVMSNYVYENGAVTPIQDIIDHAEEAKENEGSSLTST